jgi:hypothetical protein
LFGVPRWRPPRLSPGFDPLDITMSHRGAAADHGGRNGAAAWPYNLEDAARRATTNGNPKIGCGAAILLLRLTFVHVGDRGNHF